MAFMLVYAISNNFFVLYLGNNYDFDTPIPL